VASLDILISRSMNIVSNHRAHLGIHGEDEQRVLAYRIYRGRANQIKCVFRFSLVNLKVH
jgi:hypothetical protein